MNELMTDFWSILLPDEWQAEQDGETVIISDNDDISIIELTPLVAEGSMTTAELLKSVAGDDAHKTAIADMDAYYQEFEEDEVFWREWYCDAENFVLIASHGTDVSNKGMDDSMVDEILATLALKLEQGQIEKEE